MGMGNLGIALGAGVDEWNRQRANDRADKADLRAENADVRQQQMFDAQMSESKRRAAEREAATKVWNDAMPVFKGGWQEAGKHLADSYNNNEEGVGYNDGKSVDVQVHPNGVYVSPKNPDGSFGKTAFYTPEQVMHEHLRATKARLAAINPEYGENFANWLDMQYKEKVRQGERAEDIGHRDKREGVQDSQWQQNFGLHKQQVGLAGASNAIAQQRLGMERETFNAEAPNRQLKSTLGTLQLGLANASSPEERKAISDKIAYLQTGMNTDQHAPAEVKLASSLVKYGVFGDMGAALKFTTHNKDASPEAIKAKVFSTALTASMGDAKRAQQITDEAMKYLSPGVAPQQSLQIPPVEQRVVGKTTVNHPTKGPLIWSEEGGVKGWKPAK